MMARCCSGMKTYNTSPTRNQELLDRHAEEGEGAIYGAGTQGRGSSGEPMVHSASHCLIDDIMRRSRATVTRKKGKRKRGTYGQMASCDVTYKRSRIKVNPPSEGTPRNSRPARQHIRPSSYSVVYEAIVYSTSTLMQTCDLTDGEQYAVMGECLYLHLAGG